MLTPKVRTVSYWNNAPFSKALLKLGLGGPRAADVEARRLSGDNRYATIAGFKRSAALGAKLYALAEDTFFAGRKAGVPEE